MDIRTILPFAAMPFMLIAVQVGAILLSPQMQEAGYAAFDDPSSPFNPVFFVGILLLFTLILLYLIKKGIKKAISVIVGASIFFTFIYIFSALAVHIPGFAAFGLVTGIIFAGVATALLYYYPEWYVIDVLGVLLAAGIASIFGISLTIIPVLILLVMLAVYDAISVYKTKHMITLAKGVIDMKTPIMVVIPKHRSYSFLREGLSIDAEERGALVMGLGDLIMPSILVVSAHVFLSGPGIFGFTTIPAAGAMIGSLAGLALLLFFVHRGNPQAGLPSLNGGAITGFLIACALTGAWGWLPGV